MLTNGIKKNIVIRDKESAAAFVEALEKATDFVITNTFQILNNIPSLQNKLKG